MPNITSPECAEAVKALQTLGRPPVEEINSILNEFDSVQISFIPLIVSELWYETHRYAEIAYNQTASVESIIELAQAMLINGMLERLVPANKNAYATEISRDYPQTMAIVNKYENYTDILTPRFLNTLFNMNKQILKSRIYDIKDKDERMHQSAIDYDKKVKIQHAKDYANARVAKTLERLRQNKTTLPPALKGLQTILDFNVQEASGVTGALKNSFEANLIPALAIAISNELDRYMDVWIAKEHDFSDYRLFGSNILDNFHTEAKKNLVTTNTPVLSVNISPVEFPETVKALAVLRNDTTLLTSELLDKILLTEGFKNEIEAREIATIQKHNKLVGRGSKAYVELYADADVITPVQAVAAPGTSQQLQQQETFVNPALLLGLAAVPVALCALTLLCCAPSLGRMGKFFCKPITWGLSLFSSCDKSSDDIKQAVDEMWKPRSHIIMINNPAPVVAAAKSLKRTA